MFQNEYIIGAVVLVVILIVIISITRKNRGVQPQKPNQSLETDTFNTVLENELSKGLDGESLIEILGIENLPAEAQVEILKSATNVIEKRCLNRILESLNDQEIEEFADILDAGTPNAVSNFLRSKQIDQSTILREEVQRFKKEAADKLS